MSKESLQQKHRIWNEAIHMVNIRQRSRALALRWWHSHGHHSHGGSVDAIQGAQMLRGQVLVRIYVGHHHAHGVQPLGEVQQRNAVALGRVGQHHDVQHLVSLIDLLRRRNRHDLS